MILLTYPHIYNDIPHDPHGPLEREFRRELKILSTINLSSIAREVFPCKLKAIYLLTQTNVYLKLGAKVVQLVEN